MKGKVALVTGGSSSIGRATSLAFAGEGAIVVIADTAVSRCYDTAAKIRDAGGEVHCVDVDVSKVGQLKALIDETVDKYGRLDYCFNNAGIEGEQALTADSSEENWDRVVDVNLKGGLAMHEIPDPADAQARGRGHRQHVVRSGSGWLSGHLRLRSQQARCPRVDQDGGAGLRQ